jgi:hypothetical protein
MEQGPITTSRRSSLPWMMLWTFWRVGDQRLDSRTADREKSV